MAEVFAPKVETVKLSVGSVVALAVKKKACACVDYKYQEKGGSEVVVKQAQVAAAEYVYVNKVLARATLEIIPPNLSKAVADASFLACSTCPAASADGDPIKP